MLIRGTVNGLLSGICIAMGGSVFLACDNKYAGAVLFSVALLTICMFGFSLYTGKVGYIAVSHKKKDFAVLFTGLLGNAVGCFVCGMLIRLGIPSLILKAQLICTAKLGQGIPGALIRAFFCGVLMYIAVEIYKSKKSVIGIVFCIPVFILAGFEHSIADMFYFSVAGYPGYRTFIYLALIVAGNSLGGVTIPLLMKLTAEKEKSREQQ